MARFYLLAFAVLAALVFLPSEAQRGQSRFFALGTDATLQCSWGGIDNPEDIVLVKWLWKGKRIREGTRYESSSSGLNHTLLIKSIQKKDKGTYVCSPKLRSNVDIILTDGVFGVTVGKARLPLSPDARDVTLTEGGSGSVNCNYHAAKERYGLKLFWTYNGEKFVDEGRVSEDSDARYNAYTDDDGRDWLQLTYLDTGATGEYKCNYKYPDKQIFSMTFNVNVKEQVGPNDVVRNTTMREDNFSGSLHCDMRGLQNATITRFYWTKDGEELMNNTDKHVIKEKGTMRVLEINQINKEVDEGVYRCVAELQYYPIAVRFNVMVEKSRKNVDFEEWTAWSACDSQNKKFRFRTCTDAGCLQRYGFVYEVASQTCDLEE